MTPDQPPPSTARIERIDLGRVTTATRGLEVLGEAALQREILAEATAFFRGLGAFRRSRAARGAPKQQRPVSDRRLVALLLAAQDAHRRADPIGSIDHEGLERGAEECGSLAALIGAAMALPNRKGSGVAVVIDLAPRGLGELVILPAPADDPGRQEPCRR